MVFDGYWGGHLCPEEALTHEKLNTFLILTISYLQYGGAEGTWRDSILAGLNVL